VPAQRGGRGGGEKGRRRHRQTGCINRAKKNFKRKALGTGAPGEKKREQPKRKEGSAICFLLGGKKTFSSRTPKSGGGRSSEKNGIWGKKFGMARERMIAGHQGSPGGRVVITEKKTAAILVRKGGSLDHQGGKKGNLGEKKKTDRPATHGRESHRQKRPTPNFQVKSWKG